MIRQPSTESRRIIGVALGLFTLFSLLIIQFYRLQIKEHEKWKNLADIQHQTVMTSHFKRGIFYSNSCVKYGHREKPQALVHEVLRYHLFADPSVIPPHLKDRMTNVIANFLSLSLDKKAYIAEQLSKPSRSRKLVKWLTSEEKSILKTWFLSFARECKIPSNALYFVKDYQRVYPFGALLGQVLHTVREERDQLTDQAIPTGGLEMVFNHILSGEKGKKIVLRTPRKEIETKKVICPVKHGANIYLTVNHYLQAICEEELAKGVDRVCGKGGIAIMMEPYTGEILACAQYPFFFPSQYKEYYNHPERIEHTSIQPISHCFEPGSTMKAITVAIALLANEELTQRGEKPLFDPEEPICTDNGHFPGRGPLRDVKTHAFLNMDMAIQKSSNIYVARLMERVCQRLGVSWYREQLENIFGFGQKTGVELPYENSGFLPTPGKTYGAGKLQWSTPTPFSLSMGYNILVNSIQMVRAFAVFANEGYRVSPTLVKEIKDANGNVLQGALNHHPPVPVLSPQICRRVKRALKFVTKEGGAGTLGDIYGYTEAAKTSTSEKLINGVYDKNRHFSTFIGFTPVNDPKFVLFIAVDEPEKRFIPGFGTTHFGGKCAAPIFREIAKKSLEYLGIKPDDPFGFPPGDPRRDNTKAHWMEETRELAKLYKQWNAS